MLSECKVVLAPTGIICLATGIYVPVEAFNADGYKLGAFKLFGYLITCQDIEFDFYVNSIEEFVLIGDF